MTKFTSFVFFLLIFQLLISSVVFAEAPPTQEKKAEAIIESVRLTHKTAEELIPLVKPLLGNHATVAGEGQRMFIRTTPKYMEQVKQLVSDLDTPVHQLEISLSYNPAVLKENTQVADNVLLESDTATIRIYQPGDTAEKTEYYTTRGRQISDDTYSVRVLEDKWATIKTGMSIPVVERHHNRDGTVTETIHYKELNTGFRLKPRLTGDKVTLDVSAFGASESRLGGGKLKQYQTDTSFRVTLGKWFPVSANTGRPVEQAGKRVYGTRRSSEQERLIYIKVDLIP